MNINNNDDTTSKKRKAGMIKHLIISITYSFSDATFENALKMDCSLSNPHPLCQEVCFQHVTALKMALNGVEKQVIFEHIKNITKNDDIRNLLESVTGKDSRNVKDKKGWILHAFWVCFILLIYTLTPLMKLTL
jgi:hypothetical protein